MIGKVSFSAGAVGSAGLPERVRAVAEVLAAKHGNVRVSREEGGLHFNIACPACLEKEGDQELHKMHLAINADKACKTGKYSGRKGPPDDRVCMCMKCKKIYLLSKLQRMKSLAERGVKASVVGKISTTDSTAWMVQDAHGNIIPGGPGEVVPINQLTPDHPAVWYLAQRGFTDLDALYQQMRVSFCFSEWVTDPAAGRFYRRINFRSTARFLDCPSQRIVFYCDMEGVQKAWQARVIDHIEGNTKYYLHPSTGAWVPVEVRDASGKFRLAHELELEGKTYDAPSKYRTANGTERNAVLFGYDAAVRWNQMHRGNSAPVAFLVEGPLDACRIGTPGIAQVGKFLSDAQVDLLAKRFTKIVMVPDNDQAGQDTKADTLARLSRKLSTRVWDLPKEYKDVGEMPPHVARAGVQEFLNML